MRTFKSFEEEMASSVCERCQLSFHPHDLKDIGVPGIAGYKICEGCFEKLPALTRLWINDVCASWA